MPDLHDMLSDTNGPAFQAEEQRTGPPLDYVSEKLRYGLDELHRALRSIDAGASDKTVDERSGAVFADTANAALHAFSYQVTALLALHNLLGVNTGHDYTERLRRMSRADFDKWLAFVVREGSISGG